MTITEPTTPAEDSSEPGLVSLGGKLPHFLELRTAAVLDCLQALTPKAAGKANRTRLRASLASRTRIGMYLEMSANLHLAYAGQRDGRGSQHYWRLFYTDEVRPVIEAAVNGRSHSSATGKRRDDAAHVAQGAPAIAWGGMYFRSQPELKIAEALHRSGVLFFANSQGMGSLEGLPVTLDAHGMVERCEVDFLVFHKGRCFALEVDGRHHNQVEVAHRDFAKERVLLKAGIPTVRFPAQVCFVRPDDVVAELLALF